MVRYRVRHAWLFALVLLAATQARAQGERPLRNYASLDVAASASDTGYGYLGWDVYAGRRLLPWLALEVAYRVDLGQGAYAYPDHCAQMCCASQLRSWDMQQLGARVVFVPLRSHYFDVAAGVGVAGVLARERRVAAPDFGTALTCYPPVDAQRGAAAASTFVSLEVRPSPRFGLRAVGTLEIADVADWPLLSVAVGPVVWF